MSALRKARRRHLNANKPTPAAKPVNCNTAPVSDDLRALALVALDARPAPANGDEYVAVIVDATSPFWVTFHDDPPGRPTGHLAKRSFMADVLADVGIFPTPAPLASPSGDGFGIAVYSVNGSTLVERTAIATDRGRSGRLISSGHGDSGARMAMVNRYAEELATYFRHLPPGEFFLLLTTRHDPNGRELAELHAASAPTQVFARDGVAILAIERDVMIRALGSRTEEEFLAVAKKVPAGDAAILCAAHGGLSLYLPLTTNHDASAA